MVSVLLRPVAARFVAAAASFASCRACLLASVDIPFWAIQYLYGQKKVHRSGLKCKTPSPKLIRDASWKYLVLLGR